jgi:hypothetical protein
VIIVLTKECKVCGIKINAVKGDYCDECKEIAAVIIHSTAKYLRATFLQKLINRKDINKGKIGRDLMEEMKREEKLLNKKVDIK